jgi:uridine phosphorylase
MKSAECKMQNEKSEMLVCFALKEEAAPFRKMAADKSGISILITGIGRQNAEKSLREFLNSCRSRGDETQIKNILETPHVVSYDPNLVLTCGFAGGLNPDLKPGDVVFETESFSSRSRGDETQTKQNRETPHVVSYNNLVAAGAKPAKFFCADRIATTVAEKKKLRAETGADVVEMESETIHAVCREREIPCATVRVISDMANEDLPLDFNQLAKPDRNLDYVKLALAILKSPGKIGALLKLQKQTRFAAEQLADILGKTIW